VYPYKNNQYTKTLNGDFVLPVWNPNDASSMHFDVYLNSLPQQYAQGVPNNQWDYNHLPDGYGWAPQTDSRTGATVYYGVVPSGTTGATPGYTAYVGPDSVFYAFNHGAPITPADLNSQFLPNGNSTIPGVAGSGQAYTGQNVNVYLWQWWYLCLDSSLGVGKTFRPVQRVNPAQDGVSNLVTATGGLWKTNTWSGPPGPNANSVLYSNIVVGNDDFYTPAAGFVGANVMGDVSNIVNLGCSFGSTVSNVSYVGYGKRNRGHYCIFAANSVGQRQFMRIPFTLNL
jgi:hypothetical protein